MDVKPYSGSTPIELIFWDLAAVLKYGSINGVCVIWSLILIANHCHPNKF